MVAESIEEHQKVIEESTNKRVLWGWWKKETEAFPDPYLSDLKEELDNSNPGCYKYIYLVNSGTKKFYRANLYKIYYTPDKGLINAREIAGAKCPTYYVETVLPAWFEIGNLEEVKPKDLENYVFSTCNHAYAGDHTRSAISPSLIGQPIDTTDYTFLKDNVSLWFICKEDELSPRFIKVFPNLCNRSYITRGKYILHLSDVHFGSTHTFAIPNAKNGFVGKQTLLGSLERDLKAQKIDPHQIALIVISGDLTCAANPHEFDEALKFIQEAGRTFGLGAGQIICVPGNHDIEWIDQNGVLDENAELNYRNFSKNLYGCDATPSLLRINEFVIDGKKVAVIGLNSCRIESKENAGIGYVGTEQLQAVRDFIEQNSDLDYSIAVLHHHLLPVNYTELYSTSKKEVSLLLDSEAIMQGLISCGVNTVLHGHQHQPYFSKISRFIPKGVAGTEDGLDGELNIIGGGSAGVSQGELNSIGRNTYNLLQLEADTNAEAGADREKKVKLRVKLRVRNSDGVGYSTGLDREF